MFFFSISAVNSADSGRNARAPATLVPSVSQPASAAAAAITPDTAKKRDVVNSRARSVERFNAPPPNPHRPQAGSPATPTNSASQKMWCKQGKPAPSQPKASDG